MSNDAHKVPSLEHVLQTLAYHVSQIVVCKPFLQAESALSIEQYCTGFGFGGFKDDQGNECPSVHIEMVITPACSLRDDDPTGWGTWAQVYTRPHRNVSPAEVPRLNDGSWTWHGNRCGGRDAYTALCTPIVAWIAMYHAKPIVKALQALGQSL